MTDAISKAITWLELAGRLMWAHPDATATIVSAFVAILALLQTARSFRDSVNNINYTELDNMYLELLKMAIDKPYLRQPDSIYKNPQFKTNREREYDIYARMIWNFLETIADRCDNDRHLEDTWHPVIQDEGSVHKQWIRQEPKGFSKKFYRRFGPDGPFGDKFLTRGKLKNPVVSIFCFIKRCTKARYRASPALPSLKNSPRHGFASCKAGVVPTGDQR